MNLRRGGGQLSPDYPRVEDFKRLIKDAEKAYWSEKDEDRLQILKSRGKKLLEFVY